MKKNAKNDIFELDDKKLSEKILDLCLWYQIEDSNMTIKLISHQIDFCKLQKNHLLDNKPFWFQKEKLKIWEQELEEIDAKIFSYYKDIGNEINIINKMQNSISKDESELNTFNNKISFYDLLTLFKNNVFPPKLSLELCNKKETYIFDGEGNYILKDESAKNELFEYYLSDSISDLSKLDKNIIILK